MTWVKFGEANQGIDYSTSTTSSDIEQHFCQQPHSSLQVSLGQDTFTLDFTKITQTNTKSGDERPIHRVTKIISLSSGSFSSPPAQAVSTSSLESKSPNNPLHWSHMYNQNIPWTTVTLNTSDPEHANIMSLIRSSKMPSSGVFRVKQIFKIQNPYLWSTYVNRITYMQMIYPNTMFRAMSLFHGTFSANVDSICEENLDWRLYGQKNGRTYGQGA